MHIRQLFDPDTSTYSYLLWDRESREAAIVDPVKAQVARDAELIGQLGLALRYSLETHIHADHVSGGGLLRDRFGCRIGIHENSRASCADWLLREGDRIPLGDQRLRVLHTPGHTDTDVCYLAGDFILTGDTLLIRGSGRTDFQSGDPGLAYDSITRKILTLPDETRVYPGHDYHGFTQSTVGEERAFNPRLHDRAREAYIHTMQSMQLPKPRLIDRAVPGNLGCGL